MAARKYEILEKWNNKMMENWNDRIMRKEK
jgi:hypothetical protein